MRVGVSASSVRTCSIVSELRATALLAGVVERKVDLPLIAGLPHAALPPARDLLAVSGDLADEALVEAGAVGAIPILGGCPPDLPGASFDGRHEQPLDAARV